MDQPWYYVHFDSTVLPQLLRALRAHDKLPRLVTFLRDPVERLVSEYYGYGGGGGGGSDTTTPATLAEFAATNAQVRNRQVRFLAGLDRGGPATTRGDGSGNSGGGRATTKVRSVGRPDGWNTRRAAYMVGRTCGVHDNRG